MTERRHFKQPIAIDQRLAEQAQRFRKEAQGTPPGIERDHLIRRARQAETALYLNEWVNSPGLQPPK